MSFLEGCMMVLRIHEEVADIEEMPLGQTLEDGSIFPVSRLKIVSDIDIATPPRKESDASTALPDEMSTTLSVGSGSDLGGRGSDLGSSSDLDGRYSGLGRWPSWDVDRDVADGRLSVDEASAVLFSLPSQEHRYQAPMLTDSRADHVDEAPDNSCFDQ